MLLDVYVFSRLPFPGLLIAHPSRCLCAGILRDDFLNAFFEVLYVCILRGVLMCASVEVPCYVHPSRCCVLCIVRDVLLCASFEATLIRVLFFGKTSPPFLMSRCPEAVYVEKAVLICGTLIYYLLTTEATRGNFVFLEKCLPPFLCAIVFGGFSSFCFVWIE